MTRKRFCRLLENAPTVDAAPVVNGRWIRRGTNAMFLYNLECSVCGNDLFATAGYNYCPNCGAWMDGGNEYGDLR